MLDELDEAVGVLSAALVALQGAVPSGSGRPGAAVRFACGDALAQARTLLASGALYPALQDCFDLAVAAGATLNGLLGVRRAAVLAAPSGAAGRYLAGRICCFAFSAEAKVLSRSRFTSSQVVLATLAVYAAAISAMQDWALDNRLPAQYQALIALGAAVARDLTTRAAPLPRIVAYTFPRGASSLVLAYRLYGDASRADELRAENCVAHPAFMPAKGTALSE